MSSYLAVNADIDDPKFTGHTWRDQQGIINATVSIAGRENIWIAFDDPADARAMAAACTAAAEAMEQLAARETTDGR